MKKRPLPPLFLREKHLEELLPFSHSHLCEMRNAGDFPKGEPLFPGSRARVWTWLAIRQWLETRLGTERAKSVLTEYLVLFFGIDEHDPFSSLGRSAPGAEKVELPAHLDQDRVRVSGRRADDGTTNAKTSHPDSPVDSHPRGLSIRKPESTRAESASRRVR